MFREALRNTLKKWDWKADALVAAAWIVTGVGFGIVNNYFISEPQFWLALPIPIIGCYLFVLYGRRTAKNKKVFQFAKGEGEVSGQK